MPKIPQNTPATGKIPIRDPKTRQLLEIKHELPHPFKCSRCDYTATGRSDLKKHWLLNH